MARKISAEVSVKGEKRCLTVYVDDETAKVLETANDPEITKQYVLEEYTAQLSERRETRRHQSLSNGFDVVDEKADAELNYEFGVLRSAVKMLTDRQREVFYERVLENKTFKEIGEAMGVQKQTVYEIYESAVKKLKKFLE